MRNNNPEDSQIEVIFYKKGTKAADRTAIRSFKTVINGTETPVDLSKSIPISTEWTQYKRIESR